MAAAFVAFIPFLLLGLAVALPIYLARRYQLKVREETMRIARNLGLTFTDTKPWSVTGVYQFVSFTIDTVVTRSRRSRTRFTRFTAFLPMPCGCGLELFKEDAVARFGKKHLGLQDIQLGDESFDSKFIVRAADEARAKWFLTPVFREALVILANKLPDVTMYDNAIVLLIRGAVRDEKRWRAILDAMAVTIVKPPEPEPRFPDWSRS